jgi:hypothetical protein
VSSSAPPRPLHHDAVPHHKPTVIGPNDHGLNSLKS